jgi:hypothetical protein
MNGKVRKKFEKSFENADTIVQVSVSALDNFTDYPGTPYKEDACITSLIQH